MVEKTVEITNVRGLHARAAAKFVRLVEQQSARVQVEKGDMSVCGSSIMGLLMLSAGKGTQIRILAEGAGADDILQRLADLVEGRFGEEA